MREENVVAESLYLLLRFATLAALALGAPGSELFHELLFEQFSSQRIRMAQLHRAPRFRFFVYLLEIAQGGALERK